MAAAQDASSSIDALTEAFDRFDRAIAKVEARLAEGGDAPAASGDGAQADLARELAALRSREADIAAAAQEASAALDAAIREVRASLKAAEKG